MSRRILLEDNYSENGLMPVTDGLICWLDGRDGKGTDTIWKDRSGNRNDFELNGFTFSEEDGWTGKNLKVNFSQYAVNEISMSEEYTVEVDLFVDGCIYNEQTTFFYFGDGYTSGKWRELIFRDDVGFRLMQSGKGYVVSNGTLKRYFVTMSGTMSDLLFYTEGVKRLEQSTTSNVISGLTANFHLGCSVDLSRFSKARFNSVKIYNRVLTEEEIQQNYQYEQSIERGE